MPEYINVIPSSPREGDRPRRGGIFFANSGKARRPIGGPKDVRKQFKLNDNTILRIIAHRGSQLLEASLSAQKTHVRRERLLRMVQHNLYDWAVK